MLFAFGCAFFKMLTGKKQNPVYLYADGVYVLYCNMQNDMMPINFKQGVTRMKKAYFVVLFLLVLAVALAGCSNASPSASSGGSASVSSPASDSAQASASASGELTLTKEQLAAYNGQNGQPAYIAVDGVIYDVTNVPQWKNGQHAGFSAGQDVTDIIKNKSPHGVSKLNGIPVVGKLSD